MTLESTTGSIVPAAKLTLVAGSGLVLLDDMTTSSSNSALVMDVDFESEGDGTVTVWAGKTVTSNKSDVTITAWDVVMDGSLTAGTLSYQCAWCKGCTNNWAWWHKQGHAHRVTGAAEDVSSHWAETW